MPICISSIVVTLHFERRKTEKRARPGGLEDGTATRIADPLGREQSIRLTQTESVTSHPVRKLACAHMHHLTLREDVD